jgi:adenylate kinase
MTGLAVGIFGVPGVGKSTLIRAHVAGNPGDCGIEGSSVIKEVIAPYSLRDLDGWPPARQEAARTEAVRRLAETRDACTGMLLVDGHFSLRSRDTGHLVEAIVASDRQFYDAIVLVDAPPEWVIARSTEDTRRRHGQSLELVAEHVARERDVARRTASMMGVAPMTITGLALHDRLRELTQLLDAVRA